MAFNKNGPIAPIPPAPGGMPPPPGAPRPPMAPGAMPPPPGAPMMGAPKPPMAPGAMPPPNGAPMMGAPKPPMAPGAMPPPNGAPMMGGPKPMGPGMTPPNGAPMMGGPKPMGPGMTPPNGAPMMGGPKPMGPGMTPPNGAPMGATVGPKPTFNLPSSMENRSLPISTMGEFGETNVDLDSFLVSKKGYKPVRSIISGNKVTYEQYCSELSFEYYNQILNGQNLLEKKADIIKIKKNLVFALLNTKDLPDRQRDILYNASIRLVDFLKATVYYPEKNVVNDEIIAYMPILKEVAHAFRTFLLKNR